MKTIINVRDTNNRPMIFDSEQMNALFTFFEEEAKYDIRIDIICEMDGHHIQLHKIFLDGIEMPSYRIENKLDYHDIEMLTFYKEFEY